ncbi:hypothetical protein FOC84_22685 [Achromobacter pestifer]|uniref:Uncharacterized protein n=1 Tax=Achromobacter pestifer TaxID=1353889 RepID=A0A7D4INP6_9BURK|nr:hypothetical protein [Achromobacter pestifer]QKH37584.1 hypothetical protein FOC84_22685 [Achromobacter pestifer]
MVVTERTTFRSVLRVAGGIALATSLVCATGNTSASAASDPRPVYEHDVTFSPQNGGRDLRSLSVHPNGQDWLFVECVLQQTQGCQVMRFNLTSGKLFRFTLPAGHSYTYAHYSPMGTYILMSRSPIYGTSDEDVRRAIKASQLVMMRSDGTDLQIVPTEAGANLSPIMSPDESRIAFWRSDRILPPGKGLALLDLNIWEFDLKSRTEKLFAGKKFEFLTGGELIYLGQNEMLFNSYQYARPSYPVRLSDPPDNAGHSAGFGRAIGGENCRVVQCHFDDPLGVHSASP